VLGLSISGQRRLRRPIPNGPSGKKHRVRFTKRYRICGAVGAGPGLTWGDRAESLILPPQAPQPIPVAPRTFPMISAQSQASPARGGQQNAWSFQVHSLEQFREGKLRPPPSPSIFHMGHSKD